MTDNDCPKCNHPWADHGGGGCQALVGGTTAECGCTETPKAAPATTVNDLATRVAAKAVSKGTVAITPATILLVAELLYYAIKLFIDCKKTPAQAHAAVASGSLPFVRVLRYRFRVWRKTLGDPDLGHADLYTLMRDEVKALPPESLEPLFAETVGKLKNPDPDWDWVAEPREKE